MTQLLAVYDASDQLMMRFEYADARVPVKMERGGVEYYLTYDQVGSLRLVTDVAGNVVKRIDYDSFGNIIADTAPTFDVPFGFAGGLHDRDTGLVRFGFRDYDPEVGRWTAKDPIGFAGGDWNLYGYTLDDPVNFNDPAGLFIPNNNKGPFQAPGVPNMTPPLGPDDIVVSPCANDSFSSTNSDEMILQLETTTKDCKKNPADPRCSCEEGNLNACQSPIEVKTFCDQNPQSEWCTERKDHLPIMQDPNINIPSTNHPSNFFGPPAPLPGGGSINPLIFGKKKR